MAKVFALRPKHPEYTDNQFMAELLRLPESFEWPHAELIVLQLCPVAERLAKRTNWPLVRQCWFVEWGVSFMSEVRLESRDRT